MKYAESYPGVGTEVLGHIKKIIPDTFATTLRDGGVSFALPQDKDLELKVKYDVEVDGGSIMVKVSWNEELDVEAEEDDDKEED